MKAVVTMANGGYEQLQYTDVPMPALNEGEVLVQVLAAGVNNTEINTRLGWYSSRVTQGTDALSSNDDELSEAAQQQDGGWNEQTPFPFIQGTDCCGRIVAVGQGVDTARIGERVLIRSCIRRDGWDSLENIWMASDFDGAFAQFVKIPSTEAFAIDCDWSDAELGTIPCAYGTAENMVHRCMVGADDHVLVAGASGGVGSAVVQLVKRRGAKVTAIAGKDKIAAVKALGADVVVERNADLVALLGQKSVDVVIDNVAGEAFTQMSELMKRGGRYASSGAIAGPMVTLDMRNFYLKDLTFIGCTAWDKPVFPNLIGYIERGEIKPLLAKTFPLENIVAAQKEFTEKKHVGKFVLLPPALTAEQKHYIEQLNAK
jgi:NADPH:quinone reductase-like Zn-dependent oxidoreductase